METLQGIAASAGIAVGPAFQFRPADLRFERHTVDDPAAEWRRFQAAAAEAGEELAEVYARAKDELGEAEELGRLEREDAANVDSALHIRVVSWTRGPRVNRLQRCCSSRQLLCEVTDQRT